MTEIEEKAVAALEEAIKSDLRMIGSHPHRCADVANTLANYIHIKQYIEAKAAVPVKAPAKAKGDKK